MTEQELVAKLQEADKAYYDLDNPIMPDHEYDRLVLEYEILTGTRWMFQGSSGSVKHKRPMVSLFKVHTVPELVKFLDLVDSTELLVMPKIDGGGLSLWYGPSGNLIRAITRGKLVAGESFGEDVTSQAKLIQGIPHTITPMGYPVEVRGEVFMYEDGFEEAVYQREQEGKEPFKNSRNAASGILRNESQSHYCKFVNFVGYEVFQQDLLHHEDKWFEKFSDKLIWLDHNGFGTTEIMFLPYSNLKGEDPVHGTCSIKETFGHSDDKFVLEYLSDQFLGNVSEPNDGVVIMLDDMDVCRSLGYSRTHPNFGVAFKFATETAETTIRAIHWTATRTGRVVPKAIFDEVELDGTTVGQATLHNYKNVLDLDIRVNDVAEVFKANMIIPQIARIVGKAWTLSPEPNTVTECPSCESTLVINDTSVDLICTNPDCKPKLVGAIVNACGKKNWDVDLGDSVAEALVNSEMVTSLADLFNLRAPTEWYREPVQTSSVVKPGRPSKLNTMEPAPSDRLRQLASLKLGGKVSFGMSRARKLMDALEGAKSKPWHITLHALGCPGLGEPECKKIASRYGLYELLEVGPDPVKDTEDYWLEQLISIKGMGKVTAKSVVDWVKSNYHWLEDLEALGLNTEAEGESIQVNGPLTGKTLCITGSFKIPRAVLESKVLESGGSVSSSISKKTTYLLAGDNAGTKLDKALKLGVPVIKEEDLYDLIGNKL